MLREIDVDIMSLGTHKNIKSTKNRIQKTMIQTPMGFGISSISDYATGLAISLKLYAQMHNLKQSM